jgi:hypothetical protein
VTIVCWLMGTAAGDPERVAALHDGRLRMLWEKLVDTPVRGVVYEGEAGAAIARDAAARWRIPVEVVATGGARLAVDRLLGI